MDTINKILVIAAGLSLIIGVLFGLDILHKAWLNVSGTGFLTLSIACSMFAIALHIIKPFSGGSGGE